MSDQLLKLIEALGPEKRGMLADLLRPAAEPVAIVGMSCRFAGADSPDTFWRALQDGVDAITRVPKSRWDVDAYIERSPELGPTAWGGFLDDVDRFEPGVFGISPREAIQMDPQQRLILEGVWEALENAGLPVERIAGAAAGVFIGACGGGEYAAICSRDPNAVGSHTGTGVSNNMLSGRVSYVFDLHGPSVVVDTACSSSLVAVHLACESLRRKECSLALAGGVNLVLSPDVMRMLFEMQLLAADGRCKVFDARADGIARGEGCGVVVLKRLADAVADGDRVIAIVRGTASNHDGRSNGLTAPTGAAQREVIERALSTGGVAPSEISYVEAHGTGTALGDPIEVDALKEVLSRGRGPDEPCLLGSLKANIGHTEGAAGIAGLIKVALALSRHAIPPQINFRRLNPHIGLDGTPFVISKESRPWLPGAKRRVAGVSSFGWSGTNSHVVVEEAPPTANGAPDDDRAVVLPISARTPAALRALARRWSGFVGRDEPGIRLRDLAYTAGVRRSHHKFRRAVVGATRAELADGLRALAASDGDDAPASGANRIVFVFPGQGSQWPGMSRGLLSDKPFREALEACDAALRPFTGWSAVQMLSEPANEARWKEVDVIQPLLFAMHVSLAALWRSWGVEPDVVVGHSLGEIAAAHVAGALDLQDAARIIALRSRLVRTTSGKGRMALAEIDIDQARELAAHFDRRLSVAASNGPRTVLLSGEPAAVEEALASLQSREIFCRYVDVDYASHSEQMVALAPELGRVLADIRPHAASVPIYSTVSAQPIRGEALDASYWVTNLREPVLFHPTVERLIREGRDVFLEISPHPVLVLSIESTLKAGGSRGVALSSTRRDRPERRTMLESLAALYACGRSVDWARQLSSEARVVSLPTYAWQRDSYWPNVIAGRSAPFGVEQGFLYNDGLTLPDGSRVWEVDVSTAAFPFLADHRVGGMVIFPGAGYVEIALEAARAVFGRGGGVVEELRFEQMLELPEAGRKVQIAFTPHGAAGGTFQIGSAGDAGWIVHARGAFRARKEPALTPVSLTQLRTSCPEPLAVGDFFDALRLGGIDLGPSFRRLEEIFVGAGEAVARIRSDEQTARIAAGCEIDPTLLDACFQVIGCALSSTLAGSYMPVALESIIVRARPRGALWVHARTAEAAAGDDEHARGDVQLLGEDGAVLLEVRGLQLQRVGAARASVDEWMLGVEWEPQTLTPPPPGAGAAWAVLGDDRFTRALRAKLEERGDRCLVFSTSLGVAHRAPPEPASRPVVDLTNVAVVEQLVQEIGFEAGAALRGIVYAPAADAADPGGVAICVGAFHVARAIVEAKGPSTPRLCLVTRAAQPVGAGPVAAAHAALWGLGRTIPHEHPELRCSCIDLDAGPGEEELAALIDELCSDGAENQVALRGTRRLVPRLVRVRAGGADRRPADGRPFRLSGDRLRAFRRRAPGAGEVEIEVAAAALGGVGRAGSIVALGRDAGALRLGDEVVALAPGEVSTHVIVNAAAVIQRPTGITAEAAAAVLAPVAAAHHAIVGLARVSAGETVLVVDGASVEGRAAVKFAAASGARVLAIGAEADDAHRSLPAGSDATAALAANGGRRFDIVLSAGDDRSWSSILAPFGRWVVSGGDAPADVPANTARLRADLDALISEAPARLRAALEAAAPHLRDAARRLELRVVSPADAGNESSDAAVANLSDATVPIEADDSGPAIDAGATYLITGGLGGLGLEVARWLVARGARHLTVVGRSHPTPEASEVIAELSSTGARVLARRCDIADRASVASLLDWMRAELPALRGIVHAAGVLDDGVIMRLDAARFAGVMAPKAVGAWNLHTLTGELPLDFFVLFSSTASVLGSPGQSNYAAANAFLDGIAQARRAAGLPATSIDWGTWRGVGLAAAYENRGARMARKGVIGLSPKEGIAALERVMASAPTQVTVARFAMQSRGAMAALPIFARLLSELGPVAASDGKVRDEIAALAPSERRYRLETYVRKEIAGLLRLPPAAVDVAASLSSFGFDSLMALELRNRLDTRLGLRLSPTVLWARRSVEELVPYLADLMQLPLEAPAPAPVAIEEATAVDLLADDELEAALLAKLDLFDDGGSDHA